LTPTTAAEQAHRTATLTTTPAIATYLSETLGTHLVAHMCDVDPKTVRRWMAGKARPQRLAEEKLRGAYQVFRLLLTHDSEHTVRAWFIGLNPQLDDESPAVAIKEGRVKDVLAAAKSFILGG